VLDLTFNNLTADKKYGIGFFKKTIGAAIKEAGLRSAGVELSINLVGEGRIRSLNKKYRGKNKTTDVLSFPLQEKLDAKALKGGILSLGDIFLSLPVAKKYAARQGVGLDYEVSFLTVHGFLHLLGYDHEKSSLEKQKMFSLQDKILNKLDF